MKMLKLTQGGDDNQCPTCGEGFVTTEAFDKHRRGKVGARGCLDREGLYQAGMVRNDLGLWRLWNPPAKEVDISA